jgi:hypothetical protein
LGRSGFVESKGRRLGFEELGFGSEFRPSKRDFSRVVQKAKFSLSTGAEKSEILRARKSKKKFKLW